MLSLFVWSLVFYNALIVWSFGYWHLESKFYFSVIVNFFSGVWILWFNHLYWRELATLICILYYFKLLFGVNRNLFQFYSSLSAICHGTKAVLLIKEDLLFRIFLGVLVFLWFFFFTSNVSIWFFQF